MYLYILYDGINGLFLSNVNKSDIISSEFIDMIHSYLLVILVFVPISNTCFRLGSAVEAGKLTANNFAPRFACVGL